MQVYAIANQKGGIGKTPSTVHLGFALGRAGRRVLLVDMDPQGSLSEYFLAQRAAILETTIHHALIDRKPIAAIKITDQVHLLPANIDLAASEVLLPTKTNPEKRLSQILRAYAYDACLIDCPPSLGILTKNALAAADEVIIPVKPEIIAERTIKLIRSTIQEVIDSELNPTLHIWGILPTLYDHRLLHHREILQAIKEKNKDMLVYSEPSKLTTLYNEAATQRCDIGELSPELGAYWDRLTAALLAAPVASTGG